MKNELDFNDAKMVCSGNMASLVTIRNRLEEAFIRTILKNTNHIWIGAEVNKAIERNSTNEIEETSVSITELGTDLCKI